MDDCSAVVSGVAFKSEDRRFDPGAPLAHVDVSSGKKCNPSGAYGV